MNTNLLKAYARQYYKFGWNIIPLFDHSKNPATGNQYLPEYWQDPKTKENSMEEKDGWDKKQGWWPYTQRKQLKKEIVTWIDQEKLTGLGVVTGKISNLTIVDEDSYKEGGKRFNIKSPLVAVSANGGFHHYFRFNEDVSTTGLQKGVFIEIKSAGGFIVLPPSQVYKKDGKIGTYEWLTKNLKTIDDLPTIDESSLEGISVKKEIKKTILSEFTEVEYGEQHTSLRTLANSLLYRHSPQDWEEFVYPIIRQKAATYNPPHPLYRVERMIKDCSEFILRKKNEQKIPQSIQKIVKKRMAERELEKVAPSTGYIELDKILKGFIPGHVYCVSGLTNVGKSSLCSNFAVRVAKQDKKVLYFALEPGHSIVEFLASAQTGKKFVDINQEDLAEISSNIEIYTKDQIPSLKDMIGALYELPRYDLIIIDHLAYFIKGETRSGPLQEQENAIKQLVTLAQQQNSAVMFIVHMRKKTGYKKKPDGEQPMPGIDELKGSSALSQDSTDVMFITRATDMDGFTQLNEGKIIIVKTKSGRNGAMEINFVDDSAHISGPNEISARMF